MINRLILIGLLCLGQKFSGEVPLEPEPAETLEAIEPVPMDPDTWARGIIDPPDLRPVVEVYTLPANVCSPCAKFKRWLADNCDSAPFQFQVYESADFNKLPSVAQGRATPYFRFRGAAGGWHRQTNDGWHGIDYLAGEWLSVNPQGLPAGTAAPGPLPAVSTLERIAGFLPEGTRITIAPPSKVQVRLEDGTVVTFAKVSGVVSYPNGKPTLTLDQPHPLVSVKRYGLRFGAEVNGGAYDDLPTPSVSVDTSRGKYRIKLEEVPK